MQETQYVMLNQNNPILEFSLGVNNLLIIDKVYPGAILPYYLQSQRELEGIHLFKWLEKRCIPELRPRCNDILNELGCSKRFELSLSNCALSLSDSYWVKPISSSLNWADVNFFENSYSRAAGHFLLGENNMDLSDMSPDICTNGIQPKLWIKENGNNYLLKFGRPPYFQEPINEVVCSDIAMTFPFLNAVKYTEDTYLGRTVSKCKNFISPGIEMVPAFYLYNKEEDVIGNIYFFILSKAKKLGMDIEEFLNELIIFDYTINNRDRNLGNISFLRDMDTGEFLGPAPVYDNGNSLWFDETPEITDNYDEPCKPFAPTFKTQLKLFKSAKITVPDLRYYIEKAISTFENRMEADRFDKIEYLLKQRLGIVENKYSQQKVNLYEKKKNSKDYII